MTTLYYATGNELYHHGVKGMKWGRRKYQNPDGSLTPAGRKRYQSKQETKYMKKGLSKSEASKLVKSDMKYRSEVDKFKQNRGKQYATRSTGAKVATNLLGGPFANRTYNSVIAAGGSRNQARVATFAASYLGGPVGHLAVSKFIESETAKKRVGRDTFTGDAADSLKTARNEIEKRRK